MWSTCAAASISISAWQRKPEAQYPKLSHHSIPSLSLPLAASPWRWTTAFATWLLSSSCWVSFAGALCSSRWVSDLYVSSFCHCKSLTTSFPSRPPASPLPYACWRISWPVSIKSLSTATMVRPSQQLWVSIIPSHSVLLVSELFLPSHFRASAFRWHSTTVFGTRNLDYSDNSSAWW